MTKTRDRSLDTLLDLHGQVLVIDENGGYWVKFVVRRVPVTEDRPHGLSYSLTLHDATGKRLVGFDNAHGIKGSLKKDHRHKLKTVKLYEYSDPATLLRDFWSDVDKFLKEQGVVL